MDVKMKRCDECGQIWEDETVPSKESYEMGRVEVKQIQILLSPSVVKRRRKNGVSDLHAHTMYEKDFCSIQCFIDALRSLM